MGTINRVQKFCFQCAWSYLFWKERKNNQKMLPGKGGIWDKPERKMTQEKPYVER